MCTASSCSVACCAFTAVFFVVLMKYPRPCHRHLFRWQKRSRKRFLIIKDRKGWYRKGKNSKNQGFQNDRQIGQPTDFFRFPESFSVRSSKSSETSVCWPVDRSRHFFPCFFLLLVEICFFLLFQCAVMLPRESSLNHNADWYLMLWKRKKYGKKREDL